MAPTAPLFVLAVFLLATEVATGFTTTPATRNRYVYTYHQAKPLPTVSRPFSTGDNSNVPLSINNMPPIRRLPMSQKQRPLLLHHAWPRDRDPKGMAPDYPKTKSRLAVTILATWITWQAHNYNCGNSCGSVLASSAATLAASLWSPGLGQAAFAGSFAGMSSIGVLANSKETLLAGGVTAALFEVLIHRQNKFLGLGGRLGFLAFLAVNIVTVACGRVSAFPASAAVGVPLPLFSSSKTSVASFLAAIRSAPLLTAAVCGAAGAVATIVLRESAEGKSSDMADPVRASAVIGLVAALLIGFRKDYSEFGALMAFGGSFTGMSLPSRLVKGVYPGGKRRSNPWPATTILCFATAGALGGLIHAATIGLKWWSVPAGWGGKAGTCAFAGVLVFRGIEKVIVSIRHAIWGREQPNYGELY
jgi:hypothetical protein